MRGSGHVRFVVAAIGVAYLEHARKLVRSLAAFEGRWSCRVYSDQPGEIAGAEILRTGLRPNGWAKLFLVLHDMAPGPDADLYLVADADWSLAAPACIDDLWPGDRGLVAVRHFAAGHPDVVSECQGRDTYWQTCLFGGRPEWLARLSRHLVAAYRTDPRAERFPWEEPAVNDYLDAEARSGRAPLSLGCEWAEPEWRPTMRRELRRYYEEGRQGRLVRGRHGNSTRAAG